MFIGIEIEDFLKKMLIQQRRRPSGGGGSSGGFGNNQSGTSSTLDPTTIAIIIIVIVGISVLVLIALLLRKKRKKMVLKIVSKLAKSKNYTRKQFELYKEWGYGTKKKIPYWANKRINQLDRIDSASGNINFKYISKKLCQKGVVYCAYRLEDSRYLKVEAYKLKKEEIKKRKKALKKELKPKRYLKGKTKTREKEIAKEIETEKTHAEEEISLIEHILKNERE